MNCERHSVTVTTSDGSGTGYSESAIGEIEQIRYVPDDTAAFDASINVAVTLEDTGVVVWTEAAFDGSAAATRRPAHACHSAEDGGGLTYDGANPVTDDVVVAHERIKIEVTNAGAGSRTGTFEIWVA